MGPGVEVSRVDHPQTSRKQNSRIGLRITSARVDFRYCSSELCEYGRNTFGSLIEGSLTNHETREVSFGSIVGTHSRYVIRLSRNRVHPRTQTDGVANRLQNLTNRMSEIGSLISDSRIL